MLGPTSAVAQEAMVAAVQLGNLAVRPDRNRSVAMIDGRLAERDESLADAIRVRDLYFRISLVGTCNLSCTFCHNEGAPTAGKITLANAETAIAAAVQVGFTRIQFTGGEPLLRPDVGAFVGLARRYVADVGVTTNGTYLPVRLEDLVENGLRRLHVSLQLEPLLDAGSDGEWGIPDWLLPTVERAQTSSFSVRFNLPVPADAIPTAERFLKLLTDCGIDVKVFSVLPEGEMREDTYPLNELESVVRRVNAATIGGGKVLLRGFRPPSGIRCVSCSEFARCKEQSHSLRLGADLMLRPCLATRDWDARLDLTDPVASVREAAKLALDYTW